MIKAVRSLRRTSHAAAVFRPADIPGSDRWSSPLVFALAVAGATVGFNNLWEFPHLAARYGGGAFVLVYLAFALIFGVPLLMAEIMLGRQGRASPVYTFWLLGSARRHGRSFAVAGWMALVACFIIFSYLSVIAGWTLAYMARSALGMSTGRTADGIASQFATFVQDPEKQLFWHAAFVIAVALVTARGVRHGLEAAVRWLVPLLFVLLLALVLYAVALGTLGYAIAHLLEPDFTKLTAMGLLTALGHVFFSLGVGMGIMLMYAAYLEDGASVTRAALTIAGLDTVTALVAGFVIYAVLFAGGVEPATGPGLAFQALPLAFDHLPWGRVFATLFFALLTVVAFLRAIALLETVVAWLGEQFRMPRMRAALIGGAGAWALGLLSIFSFNYWAFSFRFFEMEKRLGVFDVLQILTAHVLLPLTGLAVALFAGWVLRPEATRAALGLRSPCAHDAWLWSIRVVVPILLLVLFWYLPKLYA